MNIHNIFEEQVLLRVGDTYEQLKKMNTPWLTCDCKQCRLDTAAYVLNKIPPKYIVSGRGLTHSASDANIQLAADMDTLILDGMKRVASTARPFHTKNEQAAYFRTDSRCTYKTAAQRQKCDYGGSYMDKPRRLQHTYKRRIQFLGKTGKSAKIKRNKNVLF